MIAKVLFAKKLITIKKIKTLENEKENLLVEIEGLKKMAYVKAVEVESEAVRWRRSEIAKDSCWTRTDRLKQKATLIIFEFLSC